MKATLGRYELVRTLGKGAMGVVYQASDPRLHRVVAIKMIATDNFAPHQAPVYEQRFMTEARSVAKLSHPGIVGVYDVGRCDGRAYLVMEYVAGVNLKQCIAYGVRFTVAGAVHVVCEVLDALSHAHEHRVIHRDIKPDNILIDGNGALKLTDFGVARLLDDATDNGTHVTGGTIGTPRYMSPEQVQGIGLDQRSDVFSAAVLLYELLTLKVPFDGTHALAIASAILHSVPVPVCELNSKIPYALDKLLAKALAKQPDMRYASAADFREALLRLLPSLDGFEQINSVQDAAQLVEADSAGLLRWLISRQCETDPHASLAVDMSDVLPSLSSLAVTAPQVAVSLQATAPMPAVWADAQGLTATQPMPVVSKQRPSWSPQFWGRSRWTYAVMVLVPLLVALGWLGLSYHGSAPAAAWAQAAPPMPIAPPVDTPVERAAEPVVSHLDAIPNAEPVQVDEVPVAAPMVTPQPAQVTHRKWPAKASTPATHHRPSVKKTDNATPDVAAAAQNGNLASGYVGAAAAGSPAHAGGGHAESGKHASAQTAEPCQGLSLFKREACLWKVCYTEAYRKQAACKRFQSKPKGAGMDDGGASASL